MITSLISPFERDRLMARDYIEIDTSNITIEEAADIVMTKLEELL